jgi:16S rRNA U516 pseudouridylate synthase RsuA-like enzyme
MGAKTIDDAKRKSIIRYLKKHSQNETARHFKVSPATVNGIANKNPLKKIESKYSAPINANKARKQYAKADRILVLHKLMGVIDRTLDDPELRPSNLSSISIALGTTIDKFRLEEKESDEFGKEKAEVNLLFEAMRKEGKAAAKST